MTASNEAITLTRPCVRIVPRGFHHAVMVYPPGTTHEVIWGVYDRRERADGVATEVTAILAAFVDLGLARGRQRLATSPTLTPAPVEDDGEIA